MNWNSFRLRIALLSASLAGTALIGFALTSWWFLRAAEIDRLDARLVNQIMRTFPLMHLPPLPPGQQPNISQQVTQPLAPASFSPAVWQDFEKTMVQELGVDSNIPVVMQITAPNGTLLYQSTNWQKQLDPQAIWSIPSNSIPDLETKIPALVEAFRNPTTDTATFRRLIRLTNPQLEIVNQKTSSGTWRVGGIVNSHAKVAIAVSLQAVDQEMGQILNLFLFTIPVVLVLITGGAWFLSGKTLHPIQRLTHTIQQVTVQGLDQRVPTAHTDVELVELIQVFNQMLERLERSFHQALRFSGDAAHELRTPLAILQGELEQTIQYLDDGSPLQQTLSNLLDEVRRLSGIVRKLLLLSLADAGQMQLHYVELDLAEILRELVEDIALLAPELHVHTEIDATLKLWGDRDLLTQVLQNLISNAVKYNQPDGWIHILAVARLATVQVTIRNASADIPQEDRDRIFDRFHRGDAAHTRKVEGVGLGLSLAREIVRTHGGHLTLDTALPGETAFTLTLPSLSSPQKM